MKEHWYIIGILAVVLLIGGAFLETVPETFVYLETEMPNRYKKEIRELGLLESDESIKYFYSDGFLDIKEGMYFVTRDKLVVYCKEWEDPAFIVKYDNMSDLEIEYNDGFLEDSYMYVETVEGDYISFPVSSEKGRDKVFYNYVRKKANLEVDNGDEVQPPITYEPELKLED